jgi:uncharacterized protein
MLPSTLLQLAWLCLAAFVAGGINAIAGGGSLLSFPALLQVGVLPVHANATNTVALLPGQITSAAAYRRELRRYHTMLPGLLSAAFVGGVIGARLLLATRQQTFLRMVPWLLLTATLLFALGPTLQQRVFQAKHESHASGLRPIARVLLPIGIFAISVYVGFFGAGAGLLIMATLSFAGIDSVHEINALKTVITSTSNTIAAATFIFYGAVLWRYGAAMMIAGSLGGYLAARAASKHKPRGVRSLVVTLGCIVTVYFFVKLY